jgi:hypothetical protein
MAAFTPDQISELISIEKNFNGMGFESSYRRIEDLTQTLPVVPREQYRLFCAFCLFKIQLSRTRLKTPKVPPQILLYHERLLSDVRSLSAEEVRRRWAEFGNPKFVAALESIAEGHPGLVAVLALIQSQPTGKAFLNLASEDRTKAVTDLNPRFLHFLPREPSGSLISAGEYAQVRLLPRK